MTSRKWLTSQGNKIPKQIHEIERNCGLTDGQTFSFHFFQSLIFAITLLKPTGCVHQLVYNLRSDILPTLYLCVLYLSEKKQLLVPLTA